MAKSKVTLASLASRVEALEAKLLGVDNAAVTFSNAIATEVRNIVEGEVDDLLSDLRIER